MSATQAIFNVNVIHSVLCLITFETHLNVRYDKCSKRGNFFLPIVNEMRNLLHVIKGLVTFASFFYFSNLKEFKEKAHFIYIYIYIPEILI